MKRFVPVLLAVLALAAAPVALADTGGGTSAPAPVAGQQAVGHPIARMRLEMLRLRMRIVRLGLVRACADGSTAQAQCTAFLQKVEQRLQTLDANVQKKIGDLKECTSNTTDQACKYADEKTTVLTKLDSKLQALIQVIQKKLDDAQGP